MKEMNPILDEIKVNEPTYLELKLILNSNREELYKVLKLKNDFSLETLYYLSLNLKEQKLSLLKEQKNLDNFLNEIISKRIKAEKRTLKILNSTTLPFNTLRFFLYTKSTYFKFNLSNNTKISFRVLKELLLDNDPYVKMSALENIYFKYKKSEIYHKKILIQNVEELILFYESNEEKIFFKIFKVFTNKTIWKLFLSKFPNSKWAIVKNKKLPLSIIKFLLSNKESKYFYEHLFLEISFRKLDKDLLNLFLEKASDILKVELFLNNRFLGKKLILDFLEGKPKILRATVILRFLLNKFIISKKLNL